MEVRGYINLRVPKEIYKHCMENKIDIKNLELLDKVTEAGEVEFTISYLDNKKNGESKYKNTEVIIGDSIIVPIILMAADNNEMVEVQYKKILLPEIDQKTEKQKYYFKVVSIMNYTTNKKLFDEYMDYKKTQKY